MTNLAGSEERKIVGVGGNLKLNTTVALFGGVMQRRSEVYAVVDTNAVEGGDAKPAFMGTQGSQTGLSLGPRRRS